jgi:asparagine synthase (glutamine-hydrolysing)
VLRYLSIIWDIHDPNQRAAAQLISSRLLRRYPEFKCVLGMPGMQAFCADETTDDLTVLKAPGAPEQGIIVGPIFVRGQDCELSSRASFTAREALRIVESQGRRLIDRYWGSYIAILGSADGATRSIVRAPVNAPPCLQLTFHGVHVAYSRLSDWTELRLARLSINWDYITAYSVFGRQWCSESAFSEIRELQGGECFQVRESTAAYRMLWDPCAIARSEAIDNLAEASSLLRTVTQACVHTWTAGHARVLHRLSGGLDSSIVLACLAHAPNAPSVTCEHFYSDEPSGDERTYARLVAEHCQCVMVEKEGDANIDMRGMRHITSTMIPCAGYAYLEITRPEVELARTIGATALFSGDLGDLLFHVGPASPALSEYLGKYGPRRDLLQVALDVATHEGSSIWRVLRRLLSKLVSARRSDWRAYDSLTDTIAWRGVTPGAIAWFEQNIERFVHPWLRNAAEVPEGKLWQIYLLPDDTDWHNPASAPGDPLLIRPLAGQPVVELCLRIPTYLNIWNGWDRAVARKAFAADLPKQVVLRTTKGCPEGRIRKLVARNEPFIREMLLDGALVARGILDKSKLEGAMPGSPAPSRAVNSMILEQLGTEVWLQQWMNTSSTQTLDTAQDHAIRV